MMIPSPHGDVQAEPSGGHLGSIWHSSEQPSKGRVLPSSQPSPPSILPSPQMVCLQTLGAPLHPKPGSTLQVAEQPSPLAVLPSSHCSLPVIMPSPQSGVQALPGTRHIHPRSIVQLDEQPSPLVVLPSSHCLFDVKVPLPQSPRYLHGWPTVGQIQFASIWQLRLQPSSMALGPTFLSGGTPSS